MRRVARERHERGEMPAWFRPAWLDLEEAPTNAYWRAKGNKHYAQDGRWQGAAAPEPGGGGGDEGSGSGRGGSSGGGGGWRWWREEDPYWPLRDWGDHPMRWWTLAFAAVLALGGAGAAAAHGGAGGAEAARIGIGAGAALALCGAAMSDMSRGGAGHWGVKGAFGERQMWGFACGMQHTVFRMVQQGRAGRSMDSGGVSLPLPLTLARPSLSPPSH